MLWAAAVIHSAVSALKLLLKAFALIVIKAMTLDIRTSGGMSEVFCLLWEGAAVNLFLTLPLVGSTYKFIKKEMI